QRLEIHINAAVAQERPLDHMLLCAPPGFGKSSLAAIVAHRLFDTPFMSLKMPIAEREFCRVLREFGGGIVLLDEIHAAPKLFQELLLTALEDGVLRPRNGAEEDVRHCTFIAATTEQRGVIKPLQDRFMLKPRFEEYSDDEMG